MTSRDRIIDAARAAGLSVSTNPSVRDRNTVAITVPGAETRMRMSVDFDSTGRCLGARRYAGPGQPSTLPAADCEARVLAWVQNRQLVVAAATYTPNVFDVMEADDAAAAFEQSPRPSVVNIAAGNAVVGSQSGYRPAPVDVEVDGPYGGDTFEITVDGESERTVQRLIIGRAEAEALRDRLVEALGTGPTDR